MTLHFEVGRPVQRLAPIEMRFETHPSWNPEPPDAALAHQHTQGGMQQLKAHSPPP